MVRKIKVPNKEEKRIETLEAENAELWFESIILKEQVVNSEQEIADLWFQILTGGAE